MFSMEEEQEASGTASGVKGEFVFTLSSLVMVTCCQSACNLCKYFSARSGPTKH